MRLKQFGTAVGGCKLFCVICMCSNLWPERYEPRCEVLQVIVLVAIGFLCHDILKYGSFSMDHVI